MDAFGMSSNNSVRFGSAYNTSDFINSSATRYTSGTLVDTTSTEYMLRKYSYPIICCLGFLGNTMSAVVFLSPHLRKYSCSIFLAGRSISDSGVLFSLFMVWLDFIQVRIFHTKVICQITIFLSYICSFLSVWFVVFVTIDNIIRMCHPAVVKLYCKPTYAVIVIGILISISLCIYHIPLWTIYVTNFNGKYYCMTMEHFVKVQIILNYLDTALTFAVPLSTILICMSVLICKTVRVHNRTVIKREHIQTWPSSTIHYLKVTKLLFAVSVIFLILHTPIHVTKLKVVIETFSGKIHQPSRILKTLDYIFQVLYALNFAVNFLVYYTFGNNFRQVYAIYICRIAKMPDVFRESKSNTDKSEDVMRGNSVEAEIML